VRDTTGRLTLATTLPRPSPDEHERISGQIIAALGAYARPDRVVVFGDDAGAQRLFNETASIPVHVSGEFYRLIDRRIVGNAWLEVPVEERHGPPRIVFASIKGGVGRSTALAVAAADLARRGRNVLVVDLDIEAPGLGNLLLTADREPKFGTIDFLAEDGIGGVPDTDLEHFSGTSLLTATEGGRVDVVPAFGSLSRQHPENVLSKLSRAMIEDVSEDGDAVSVASQISTMIDRLVARAQYDVVLVDSRAGLAELTAPALLGLGATVLLFGLAQQQTLNGLRILFAALKLLAQRDLAAGRDASWRLLLKSVYAKASFDSQIIARHRDDLYELFAEFIYDADEESSPDAQKIVFAPDDPSAPHWPLVIPFNANFVNFDSARDKDQLARPFYEQTFREFLNGIDEIIAVDSP
jgi:cellulose biosynthesis protein BcsQ